MICRAPRFSTAARHSKFYGGRSACLQWAAVQSVVKKKKLPSRAYHYDHEFPTKSENTLDV